MNASKYVVANWKMNFVQEEVDRFLLQFQNLLKKIVPAHKVIICPSHVHISRMAEVVQATQLFYLGAQDCSGAEKGAFTGDVSAIMLKDQGVQYVLIGHSERRLYHHEENSILTNKLQMALKTSLCPILCVGETLEERESGQATAVIAAQLGVLEGLNPEQFMIAYEPVWAIGTGRVPSVRDVEAVHSEIKKSLLHLKLKPTAVLYGGSVSDENASGFLASSLIDGLLVGGASLKPDTLYQIARA